MSLFRTREWWHARAGPGEEFDCGSLCIANIDNDPSGTPKIITGSFKGMLRMYVCKERDFKVEDLRLEQELDSAILQITAGRFSSHGGTQLAVLHPRKVAVYSVSSPEASYMVMNKLYEHHLDHTAANMTCGAFGGAKSSADYLAVQSYDGQLSIFECESFTFARFLPGFLIPGPLAYCEASDSFVTCTSGFELESYKYNMLAAATSEKETASTGHSVGKRVAPDWRLVLGEMALDIRPGRITVGLQSYQSDLVVLCEHHVFVVSSIGQLVFQKRLDYHPACCCTYAVPLAKAPGGPENLLVATHTKSLQVYRAQTLVWAAKTDTQPVAVAVADLGPSLRGMVVSLDDAGSLVVSYLGTEPMVNAVGYVDQGKALDYEAMAREHRSLAAIIREHSGGTARAEPADCLSMRTHVPSRLSGGDGGFGALPTLTFKVSLSYVGGASSLSDVELHLRLPPPLTCDAPTVVVPHVSSDPNNPSTVSFTLMPGSACVAPSATATLCAAYTTGRGGDMRSQVVDVALPLALFCEAAAPSKSAAFRITVGCGRTPPALSALFDDMLACASPDVAEAVAAAGGGVNAVALRHFSGPEVTILVSKTGGRYRLQSEALEAMWLPLAELSRRLGEYYVASGDAPSAGDVLMTFEDALPLEDVFEVVDHHFGLRVKMAELRQQLESSAVQFRQVEKRLLMRFKDKNPSPLNQLDFLMDETYDAIMATGAALDNLGGALADASARLSCAVQLLLMLVRFRFALPDEEYGVLRSHLSPEVTDGHDGVGWEEVTEAGMLQLLRGCLAKTAKEAAVTLQPLQPAKDTAKLKKHLGLVLERLSRGMRMQLQAGDRADVGAPRPGQAGGRQLPRQPSGDLHGPGRAGRESAREVAQNVPSWPGLSSGDD